jgi:hypothetical protein
MNIFIYIHIIMIYSALYISSYCNKTHKIIQNTNNSNNNSNNNNTNESNYMLEKKYVNDFGM